MITRVVIGSMLGAILTIGLVGTTSAGAGGSRPAAATRSSSGRLVTFSYHSRSLGHDVPVEVYLPPEYPKAGVKYPVLTLLHGLPGSGPQMLSDLNFVATVDKLIDSGQIQPLVVIAPSDGPTAGTDTEWINSQIIRTWRWGTLVDYELVAWADSTFQVCDLRSGRALGGISMGGFGAMNDALRALGEFGAVTLWSPYFVSNTPLVDGPAGSVTWREDSPLYNLSPDLSRLAQYPIKISFYVGKSDEFEPQDTSFAKLLTKDKLNYRFAVIPGGHDYALWRSELSGQLRWLSGVEHC